MNETNNVIPTPPERNYGQVLEDQTDQNAIDQTARDAAAAALAAAGGLSGNSFVPVYGDGANAIANGNALKAAYTAAKALTPNGSAKSATNRACVLVFPGRYDLVAGSGLNGLLLDTQFVDLVGVGARKDIYITSAGRTVAQTANDVLIKGVTLNSTSTSSKNLYDDTDDAAYFPDTNMPLAKMVDVNCVDSGPAFSHRYVVDYAGDYQNCTGGDSSFGSGGTFSGTATNCTGGDSSFGGDGTFSGTATNCTGSSYSFGGVGTFSGKAYSCTGGYYSFGGGVGTFSGTANNCTGGDYSFGGEGTFSGTATNCTVGGSSFGSDGTFSGKAYRCNFTTANYGSPNATGGQRILCIAQSTGTVITDATPYV